MKTLLDLLWVVINPRWWVMLNSYDKVWDYELNRLMDTNDCEYTGINKDNDRGPFCVDLGGKSIWICNYPYSYGHLDNGSKIRPSRLTMLRLRRKVEHDRIASLTATALLREKAINSNRWYDWFLIHWNRR